MKNMKHKKITLPKMVCPWWLCFSFDNPLRRLFHDPEVMLGPYVRSSDRVLDIGSGMGYFTIPLAKLVGPAGRVTAIDLQPQMLAGLKSRAVKNGVADRITLHLAGAATLGVHSPADFILAFWMLHEVPDQRHLLTEIRQLLKPQGSLLLVEPLLHVSRAAFAATLQTAFDLGFTIKATPQIRLSQAALLVLKDKLL